MGQTSNNYLHDLLYGRDPNWLRPPPDEQGTITIIEDYSNPRLFGSYRTVVRYDPGGLGGWFAECGASTCDDPGDPISFGAGYSTRNDEGGPWVEAGIDVQGLTLTGNHFHPNAWVGAFTDTPFGELGIAFDTTIDIPLRDSTSSIGLRLTIL